MKQASIKKDKEQQTPSAMRHIMKEGMLVFFCAFATYLLLALFTYHHGDPGWTSTGNSKIVANAGGLVGAWFADMTLFIFGYAAYIFPLMLAYFSWVTLSPRKTIFPNFALILLRLVGFILFLFSFAALLNFKLGGYHSEHFPFEVGGVLGAEISKHLIHIFNDVGTSIILLAAFCCGLTLFCGISWINLLDYSGAWLIKFLRYTKIKWQQYREWRKKMKSQTAIKVAEKPIIPETVIPVKTPKTEPKIITESEASPVKPPTLKIAPPAKVTNKPISLLRTNDLPTTGLPALGLLDAPDHSNIKSFSHEKLEELSRLVEARLKDFGVEVQVVAVHPGPVITRFEMELAPGIKVNRITTLAKDLARSLSVISVRVVEVIPGKSYVGLELPNEDREIVRLREILSSQAYEQARSPVTLALGKDIAGHPVVVDLAKMPHLLVAGTTGSGKSVGLNAMLLGLLYKSTPKDLRLILVDPKMLELSIYEGIPHLLTPVVTDMKEAANALRWCIGEMERRYRVMAALGVRNLMSYNNKVKEAEKNGKPIEDPIWIPQPGQTAPHLTTLPTIVLLIDEYADMMMVVGKKVEQLIARLAQKARAAGIHLILATQRPSVDVVTGLIKANIPTRITYQVSSKIDSRTVLDQGGAEQLLGYGDMLYLPSGTSVPVRIHGAYVADEEVHKVVADWKLRGTPEYVTEVTADESENSLDGNLETTEGEQDPLYDQAVYIVTSTRRATISSVQRRLKIGYNRAARLIEDMERAGIVSSMETNGTREVLAPPPVGVE